MAVPVQRAAHDNSSTFVFMLGDAAVLHRSPTLFAKACGRPSALRRYTVPLLYLCTTTLRFDNVSTKHDDVEITAQTRTTNAAYHTAGCKQWNVAIPNSPCPGDLSEARRRSARLALLSLPAEWRGRCRQAVRRRRHSQPTNQPHGSAA